MPSADASYLPAPDASPWLSQGASLTLHVGVMVLLAFLVPPAMANGETSAEDVEWIRHVLASAGTAEDDGFGSSRATPENGTTPENGNRETRREGDLGFSPPPSSSPSLPVHPSEGRAVALEEAAAFGMVGLLFADPPVLDSNLPPSPWARGEVNGSPHGGALWSDAVGDGLGFGGVALSGIGEGAGGRGEGISIGGIGSLGHGDGESSGWGVGCGCGRGRIGGSHQTRAPAIRCGPPPDGAPGRDGGCTATVHGRLPPEAVQRVVRQSFGRFRLCYEDGLRRDPGLEGRVSVKFVIDRQGGVAMAADAGSEFRDESVVACVVRGFQALSFPQPEGGIVTVVYPLVLSPTDAP
jgi:hypothetical protein